MTRPAKRTWWILPFSGGVLSVVVVAVAVTLLQQHFHVRFSKPHPARSTPAAAATVPMPEEMFPDALFGKLTQDLQTQNEAGFLDLVAPGARSAVRTWWENLQAIGFTSGAVIPTAAGDTLHVDRHGNGTTTVLAGAHNPLDALDQHNKPAIPFESYQIGVHFASPTAIGQITSWKAVGDDPLGQGVQLYVRKTAHVVVAGLPADSGFVDETLPLAEAAASYDIGMMNHVDNQDLLQQGFVVFVSGNAAETWFGSGPDGWPAGIGGGRTVPLPGPRVSADSSVSDGSSSLVGNIADDTTGGARVVIMPYQDDSGTPHGATVTLVRDFMLDILAAHDQQHPGGAAAAPGPSWALEGLAVAVQGLFEKDTNPTPATYNFGVLTSELRSMPKSYRSGKLPTSPQMFSGSLNTQESWNAVAASVYEYIELKAGMNHMLGSSVLLWSRLPTPFGNVLKSSSKGTSTFFTSASVMSGWHTWLARL